MQRKLEYVIKELPSNDECLEFLCINEVIENLIEKNHQSQSIYQNIDEAIQIFCNVLEKNSSIKKISFSDYRLGFIQEVSYANAAGLALKDHPTLEEVYIELIYSYDAVIGFLQCLTGNASIKLLYLRLCGHVPEDFMNNLGRIFAKNKSLKTIRIELKDDALYLYEFGKGIVQIPSLENLCLQDFKVTKKSMMELTNVLKEMTTLKHLSLQYMRYNDKSMPLLSEVLKKNPNLETLKLSGNYFRARGLKILFDTLPFFANLKKLFLDDLIMRPDDGITSVLYLGDIMRRFQLRLESLHIKWQCGFCSFLSLAILIHHNIYLKELFTDYFSDAIVQQCIPLLSNPNECHLRELHFDGQLKDVTYSLLIKVMDDNFNLLIFCRHNKNFEKAMFDARKKNVERARLACLHQSRELANVYYSKTAEISLPGLPLAIIFLILKMLWDSKDAYIPVNDLLFYHKLNFQNFSIRRRMIEEKKYDPKDSKDISAWWFRELKQKKEIDTYITEQKTLNSDSFSKIVQEEQKTSLHGFFNTIVQNAKDTLEVAKFFWKMSVS